MPTSSLLRIGKLALLALTAAVLLPSATLRATVYAWDDFTYASGTLANGTNAGGGGWSGAWTGNTAAQVSSASNLSFASTGYTLLPAGTGLIQTSSTAGSVSYRTLADAIDGSAGGTQVWFSVLLQSNKSGTSTGRTGLYWNLTGNLRDTADAGFLLVGTDFRTWGGSSLVTSGKTLATDATHLVVGRISLLGTGASSISLWLDPANVSTVSNLGTASVVFSANFGGQIFNVGVESYAQTSVASPGLLDAVRLGSDLGSVVAIPEPSAALWVGAAAIALALCLRKRRRASDTPAHT